VSSATPDRPADTTEPTSHHEGFCRAELLADALSTARGLAETQASLRRLALLVAEGATPDVLFTAVTKEALRHFGGGTARTIRYECDGTATLLANEGTTGPHVRVGEAWQNIPPDGLAATIRRTGRSARIEDYGSMLGGEVFHQEGLRSAVGMPIYVHGRLWGMIAVGSGSGNLPLDTEQRMTDFTELIGIAVANAQSRAELIASRARIVTASDEVRRRIERDLHDGAQQRLVRLALRLRMAGDSATVNEWLNHEIDALVAEVLGVLDDLREISRGIHPALLSEAGLGAAVRMLARRSTVPVQTVITIEGRLPDTIEACAYYVLSELLTNTAKHARASFAVVEVAGGGALLRLCVCDDGVGGADPTQGSGLIGVRDRVEALGGKITVSSEPGRGTRVSCELPTTTVGFGLTV